MTELDTTSLAETLRLPEFKARNIVPIQLDLRSQESINTAFERALGGLSEIDLLVNNAARALVKRTVDVTPAEWNDIIDTNLKGSFFLTQCFGRYCIDRSRPGAIVSIVSTHGVTGIAQRAVYGISKAVFDKNLAIDGRTRTSASRRCTSWCSRLQCSTILNRDHARTHPNRFVTPESSRCRGHSASPAAASVTGHTLMVDGD